MAVRMKYWVCKSCNSRNDGHLTHCHACTAPRGKEDAQNSDPNAAEVTDEAMLALALAGKDWPCEGCGGMNKAAAKSCENCGSPREKAKRMPVIEDDRADILPMVQSAGKLSVGVLALGGTTIALCVWLIYFFLIASSGVPGEVVSTWWERQVDIEEKSVVTDDGWEVPENARVLDVRERQKGTKEVVDHYETRKKKVKVDTGETKKVKVGVEDLENGFERDIYEDQKIYKEEIVDEKFAVHREVPVMANYYTYEYDKWTVVDTKTTGTDHPPPGLAEAEEVAPYSPQAVSGPNQRLSKVREKYRVVIRATETGKEYPYPVSDEKRFADFPKGSKHTLNLNRVGILQSVE